MKALLQRVASASVTIAGVQEAAIGPGLLVLVGVERGDTAVEADWLATKTAACRIFPGDGKAMNRSMVDVAGEALVVSQFTLAADTERGNRPGFTRAAEPDVASALYLRYVESLRQHVPVQTGRFGADMQVALVNDGPVTILLERLPS